MLQPVQNQKVKTMAKAKEESKLTILDNSESNQPKAKKAKETKTELVKGLIKVDYT